MSLLGSKGKGLSGSSYTRMMGTILRGSMRHFGTWGEMPCCHPCEGSTNSVRPLPCWVGRAYFLNLPHPPTSGVFHWLFPSGTANSKPCYSARWQGEMSCPPCPAAKLGGEMGVLPFGCAAWGSHLTRPHGLASSALTFQTQVQKKSLATPDRYLRTRVSTTWKK